LWNPELTDAPACRACLFRRPPRADRGQRSLEPGGSSSGRSDRRRRGRAGSARAAAGGRRGTQAGQTQAERVAMALQGVRRHIVQRGRVRSGRLERSHQVRRAGRQGACRPCVRQGASGGAGRGGAGLHANWDSGCQPCSLWAKTVPRPYHG